MYNCIIVDDEMIAITNLKRLLQDYTYIHVTRTFTKAEDAIEFINANEVDMCFLDIRMPKVSGIDLGRAIAGKSNVIYTTSTPKYAFDSYLVGATDYLLKPVVKDKLEGAIKKAIKNITASKLLAENNVLMPKLDKTISIIANRKIYNLKISDLMYIESKKEYLCYNSLKSQILSLGSLKECNEVLPNDTFVRIHKSYIVNWNYVASYTSTELLLINDIELPIGRFYRDDVKEYIDKFNKQPS